MKHIQNGRKNTTAEAYAGTNETINRLMEPDDILWVVQGPCGRRPMFAATAQEAIDDYLERFYMEEEEEENEYGQEAV